MTSTIMLMEDICRIGEGILQETLNKTNMVGIEKAEVISFAEKGLAQLDMLHRVTCGGFGSEKYDLWYNRFYKLIVS